MQPDLEYVGFWARAGAAFIDILWQLVLTAGLTLAVYGTTTTGGVSYQGPTHLFINFLLPAAVVIAFWLYLGATPGKLALRARIVDARTGEPMGKGQAALRYLGYFVSLLPFGLGYLWVAFDRRKQGWHDKIAGTVVVRPSGTQAVVFEKPGPAGS
jgi:uncharacterized RDD family membrane protein YckC